jgi:hypothetical protein
MTPLAVSRSPLRMWLLALGGVPLLVIGVDILLEQRIFRPLQEALFPADSPQIFEPRDTVWAWAFIVIGAVMVAWGLKELLAPAKVVTCDAAGVYLRLSGPFRPPSLIRWSDLLSVHSETFDDGGEAVEALIVEVGDNAELPDDPWGARWIESGTLAMLAEGWDQPAGVVADRIESLQNHPSLDQVETGTETGVAAGIDAGVGTGIDAGEAVEAPPETEDPARP